MAKLTAPSRSAACWQGPRPSADRQQTTDRAQLLLATVGAPRRSNLCAGHDCYRISSAAAQRPVGERLSALAQTGPLECPLEASAHVVRLTHGTTLSVGFRVT